jgi:hypothetical protein
MLESTIRENYKKYNPNYTKYHQKTLSADKQERNLALFAAVFTDGLLE